eukprot:TRINITY_DN17287_c0_g1_i1.p1 TRINITY_DN17287_c0_g1~~TRINITY_DN17287_c0_g1_i1.p1  ORF type:complete len:162 (+),score=47.68 TRINITY_DN17287_c0_g1_i1:196-681(+)
MSADERPLKRARTAPAIQMAAPHPFDRDELVRLMTQCAIDLGYTQTAAELQHESGVSFQSTTINQFRAFVMEGRWEEAVAQVPVLELVTPEDSAAVHFLLKEQKYLELLERGEVAEALVVLQTELTPLGYDERELHRLTALVMCTTPAELYARHEWAGNRP